MGLKGKLIAEYEVRSSGDLVHELIANKPHQISEIAPAHIQGCDLHEGEFGKNGSIIFWSYTNNGTACVAKQVVENICMEGVNKTLTMREIEGDLLKSYKTFLIHLHVKTEAGNISLVNWTLEYEKLHEDVPHPTTLLEVILNMSKNIEEHHLDQSLNI